ncbi:MAG TPA: hypothetical protein VGP93_00900, partial [Polyangiaceae bacterium]|nr:hypothetical protein [Polyangiaceae bacterium]
MSRKYTLHPLRRLKSERVDDKTRVAGDAQKRHESARAEADRARKTRQAEQTRAQAERQRERQRLEAGAARASDLQQAERY